MNLGRFPRTVAIGLPLVGLVTVVLIGVAQSPSTPTSPGDALVAGSRAPTRRRSATTFAGPRVPAGGCDAVEIVTGRNGTMAMT